jgi:hypothetical protein
MAEQIPPGPPHLQFMGRSWPRWAIGIVLACALVAPLLILVSAALIFKAPDPPHGTFVSPPVPVTPVERRATIRENRLARPIVVDVDGDGTADVLALAVESVRAYVVAFDGAHLGDVLWTAGPFDGSDPQLAVADQYVAISTPTLTNILDLRTGKETRVTTGARHVWHPHAAAPETFHFDLMGDKTDSFEPKTDSRGPAPAPSCNEDESACLTRDPRERVTLKQIYLGDAIKVPGQPHVDGDTRAWIVGDRFVARARSKVEGHEIAFGGKRRTHSVDWVADAAGDSEPTEEAFTLLNVSPRWDVDPAAGIFAVVVSSTTGPRLVVRSTTTGTVIWQHAIPSVGTVTIDRDRVYVGTGDSIDVFDAVAGARLATLRDAVITTR